MDAKSLKEMGFDKAEVFAPRAVKDPDAEPHESRQKVMTVVRVYTDKGWQYGKFNPGDDAAIAKWAAKRVPKP